MNQLREIKVSDIIADPNQPRKYFDQAALEELIQSVKANGVLQPVMVRETNKPEKYMLVCGERRFRASKEAGLEVIPAVIRKLTDAEALEIQIIENLQRIDVHPMEEAVAFKSVKEKFDIDEIATRVGKSKTYVAQRIKLVDLIQPFQDLFFHNAINLTEALRVCVISAEDQKELIKEAEVPKDWKERKNYEFPNWIINRVRKEDLTKASFDITDAALYPKAGSCATCPQNSANNQLLFPELNQKSICHNTSCFAIKASKALKASIDKYIQDPDIIFVHNCYYPGSDEKAKLKSIEDMGVKLYGRDQFEIEDAPEDPGTFQEYCEEENIDLEDSDLSVKERKELKEETLADYNRAVEHYKKDVAEYQEKISKGNLKKALLVYDAYRDRTGHLVYGKIKIVKTSKAISSSVSGQVDLKIEMETIKQREKRKEQLDREKVTEQLSDALVKDLTFKEKTKPLNEIEMAALAFAMYDAGSIGFKEWVSKALKAGSWHSNSKKVHTSLLELKTPDLFYKLVRRFILDKCKSTGDYENSGSPSVIFSIAKMHNPSLVTKLVEETEAKSIKRKANVKKRMDALKSSLKEKEAPAAPKQKKSKKEPVTA